MKATQHKLHISIISILVTFLFLAFLTGCNGSGGSSETNNTWSTAVYKLFPGLSVPTGTQGVLRQAYQRMVRVTGDVAVTFTMIRRDSARGIETIPINWQVQPNSTYSSAAEIKTYFTDNIIEAISGSDANGNPVTAMATMRLVRGGSGGGGGGGR